MLNVISYHILGPCQLTSLNILSNFEWICPFHNAIESGASMDRIDNGVKKFIQAIGFPFDLKGDFQY